MTIEDIDAILNARKNVAGVASWVATSIGAVKLKAPLAIDGAIKSSLFLQCTSTTQTIQQHGSLVLVWHDMPIERMNFFPQNAHANKFLKNIPNSLRGLSFPEKEHRYYAWKHNRRWPRGRGDNMDAASHIDKKIGSYREAINYFFGRINVVGTIPEPPHEPRFEFDDRH